MLSVPSELSIIPPPLHGSCERRCQEKFSITAFPWLYSFISCARTCMYHLCEFISDFTCKVFNLNVIFLFIPSDFIFVFKCGMRRRKRIQFWIKNRFPTGNLATNRQPKIIFCKFHRIRLDRLFYIIILRPQLRNSIIMELTMSGTHNDKWTDQDQNDKCSQLSYPV